MLRPKVCTGDTYPKAVRGTVPYGMVQVVPLSTIHLGTTHASERGNGTGTPSACADYRRFRRYREAFAHLLANENCDLILIARSENELNRVRGLLVARHPTIQTAVIGRDLSELDSAMQIEEELSRRNLLPDIVINNAGFGLYGPTEELPIKDQLSIIDLNTRAMTELCLRFMPHMLERNDGGFINVASTAAFMPGPYMTVYYASKAFLLSFSEGLAAELAGTGVTVTTLCPGPVRTGFQARAGMQHFGMLQNLMAMSASDVAQAGWDGFKQHRRVVIPGVFNMIAAYSGRYMPRWLVLPVVNAIQAPRRSSQPDTAQ